MKELQCTVRSSSNEPVNPLASVTRAFWRGLTKAGRDFLNAYGGLVSCYTSESNKRAIYFLHSISSGIRKNADDKSILAVYLRP